MLEMLLNAAPLLRPVGIPVTLRNVCLIAFKQNLFKINEALKNYPFLQIRSLVIPDVEASELPHIKLVHQDTEIPVSNLSGLPECPQLEKVVLLPENALAAASLLTRTGIFAANYGVQNFYLLGKQAPDYSLRKECPDFFIKCKLPLEKAFDFFTDESSKQTYIGRIKAILTGDAGYIPLAPHSEYFHPQVAPKQGQTLIDGGVSDMIQVQRQFIEAVGPNGHIFGFEPMPEMAHIAAQSLENYPTYTVHPLGLSNRSGKAYFEDLRDSSHILKSKEGKNVIECELTSIDEFCRLNHIQSVDVIKLDVEGSELAALEGAIQTIRKSRPMLIICLYHKNDDLFEIPIFIKTLVPDYKLYLAHSSCQFTDTILYAKASDDRNCGG